MNHPLSIRTVHQKLLLRLILMGGAIALLLGAAVWIYQHNRIDTEIVDRASHSVKLINEEVRTYLQDTGRPDIEGLQHELEAFSAHVLRSRSGRFVAVRIYSTDFKLLAAVKDPEDRPLEDREAFPGDFNPPPDTMESARIKTVHIAGRPHLQIMAPLSGARGQVKAYIFAVYALSEKAVSSIHRNTARAVFAVFGIVISTTSLLYPVIVILLRKVAASSRDLLNSHLETLKLLGSAISKRDHGTDLHNYRVTIIAVYLAEACGLPPADMHGLIKGAFLHDIGKLAVPDHILLKQGQLSEEEFSIMQRHVLHGMDIVRRSKWLADALPVVGFHHEKFNGKGYSHHLKGWAIPLAARIFAVADVFDALTSERQYKKAFTLERTMAMMEAERGRHFDPAVLDRFKPIAGKLHEHLTGKGPAELQDDLQTIINAYFAPEEAVADALQTLTPGKNLPQNSQTAQNALESVAGVPYPDTLKETTHTEDGCTLYLVPPAELKLSTGVIPGMERVTIPPLYLSENPVTNQQYVDFLNKNMDETMNYPADKYNLRGINQLGEWGKTAQGEWVVMGRRPSGGSGIMNTPKADPAGYYADTSFRVVQDAPEQ